MRQKLFLAHTFEKERWGGSRPGNDALRGGLQGGKAIYVALINIFNSRGTQKASSGAEPRLCQPSAWSSARSIPGRPAVLCFLRPLQACLRRAGEGGGGVPEVPSRRREAAVPACYATVGSPHGEDSSGKATLPCACPLPAWLPPSVSSRQEPDAAALRSVSSSSPSSGSRIPEVIGRNKGTTWKLWQLPAARPSLLSLHLALGITRWHAEWRRSPCQPACRDGPVLLQAL